MVIASFEIEDKLKRARFFQETFLVANISIKVVLEISFLTISNADVFFVNRKLTWRTYNPNKALLTTKRV